MMSPASFPFASGNFAELLQRRAELHGSVPACTFLADGESREETWTYAELDRRARTVAAWLQVHGAVGQPVLLVYPQGLDFIAAFFGCLYAGAIAVPAYAPRRNRRAHRIGFMVSDTRVQWALTTQEILDQLTQSVADEPLLSRPHWQATDRLEACADNWQVPRITAQSLALLQYTSGSSGTPKGVMVTHGNLLENQRLITHSFCQDSSIVCVGWLPLHHDMGLIGNLLHPLYHGGRFVFLSPVAFLQQPSRWLRAITRYRATIAGGPNFAFELCVTGTSPSQREGLDLRSWAVAFTGAERVNDTTLRAFTDTFSAHGFAHSAFCPCYGLAESTLLTTGCRPTEPVVSYSLDPVALQQRRVRVTDSTRLVETTATEIRSARPIVVVGCGVPAPHVTVRIVNPDTMIACPPAEVGEIWVSGPTVAVGYWGQDAATRDTFAAQLAEDTQDEPGRVYLRTGDFGFLQDGQLFVTERLQDRLIVRGGKHHPSDLEQTASHSHLSLVLGSAAAFSVDVDDEELSDGTPRTTQDWRSATPTSDVRVHPLLGWRLNLAGREIVYETDLTHVDYLADHRVGGTIVMPATGYLELALAAGRDASFKFLEIRDLKIRRPMLFDEHASGRVQVVLAPDGAGFACRILRWTADRWQAHATCRLEAEGDEQRGAESAFTPPEAVGPEVSRSVAAHYAACRAVGLEYGPAFQGIRALWSQGHGAARGAVALPSDVDARGYLVHPALLYACLQVISAAFPPDMPHAWLPLRLSRYRVWEQALPPGHLRVNAWIQQGAGAQSVFVDFLVTNKSANNVLWLQGLQLRRADGLAGTTEPKSEHSPAVAVPTVPVSIVTSAPAAPWPAKLHESDIWSQPVLVAFIRERVAQLLESKVDEVPVDHALDALGFNSTMAFELRKAIKQNLGLEVSLEVFLQNITLVDLASLLIEKLAIQPRDTRSVVAHTETSPSGSEGRIS